MRVIAGSNKGTALRCGRGPQFRPTAQIVRGSIFDTLGEEVTGSNLLDLFAGSGAVGIEALSRGARHVTFIEQDHTILRALRTNLQRCRLSVPEARVRTGDAMRFLQKLIAKKRFFDIIFADPPYASKCAQEIVQLVEGGKTPVCRQLIIEHGNPLFHNETGPLEKIRTKKFGQTYVTYFLVKGGEPRGTDD